MDWKAVGQQLAKLGLPILGTALGGPAGAAIGEMVGEAIGGTEPKSPQELLDYVTKNAEALKAAKEFELREKQMLLEHIAKMYESETKRLEAVNTTMQAEAKSEHWAQWAWRPFNGFIFGIVFVGNYFILPLLKITPPTIPMEAWAAIGAVLGVASWHRGRKKLAETLGEKWTK